MVFSGRFNTACHRCRRRKVKCDQAQPSCTRCAIYGQPCPGYSSTFSFRNNRTSIISYPTTSTTPTKNNSSVCGGSPAAYLGDTTRSPMPEALAPPQDHALISNFIARFVCSASAIEFPGHLNFLVELYDHHVQGPFELATLSIARMVAFNRSGLHSLRQQSYKSYGCAIKELKQVLESQESALCDKTIGTLLLLCLFDDVSGNSSHSPGVHAPGLYYLLQQRGYHQFTTARGLELFFYSVVRLQTYSSLTNDLTFVDITEKIAPPELSQPANMLMRALSITCRSMKLCRDLSLARNPSSSWPASQPVSASKVSIKAIQACSMILHEFDEWDRNAGIYWISHYKHRTKPPTLGETIMAPRHYDSETANIVTLIRSSRLRLSLTLSDYCRTFESAESHHQGSKKEGKIASVIASKAEREAALAVRDIVHCLPYALGDVDSGGEEKMSGSDATSGVIILSSLKFLMDCGLLTKDQMLQVQGYVSRILAATGFSI
ncbi:hypothetical protein EDB81DRAFT_811310 [Dactylonectria macrodidyma]|uniref:Zn(2)-C6 fungal-type domain-containing protein n=1 Tax=Dactylonectria macrodidyma TaxID=307937 RepID=A0A9P9IML1_9HYPO|nr:hypothetical protein EDB81DRAFT_811310 [Dactylonectria macrodidyma]